MKRTFLKNHEHITKLGRRTFENVPVLVGDDDDGSQGFSLCAETIQNMEREVAKDWLLRYVAEGREHLRPDELHGIQLALGVNASQMAGLLGLSKGTISKIYQGDQPIQKPWAMLAIQRLKSFLMNPDLRGLLGRKAEAEGIEPVGAIDIANYFLHLNDNDDGMSNMKINKLLYYAQGISLGMYGRPAFRESVVAYAHGPVVHAVYRRFKGEMAILCPKAFDPQALPPLTRRVVEYVFQRYGHYTATRLRSMSHQERPWAKTQQSAVISHKLMQEFFAEQLKHESMDLIV